MSDFLRQTRGWGRFGSFLGLLVLLWLPQIGLILLFTGWNGAPTNTQNILAAIGLYGALIGLIVGFARLDHQKLTHYGLLGDRLDWQAFGWGMMLGIASLGALFGLESCFGLVVWHQTTQPWALLLLTGLVEGLAFALSEELLFRGFLINLWVETSGWRWAIFWSALIFAISHFIRPIEALIASWPQFPGLLLMGFILGSARYWLKDRLGLGIGLHGSWIWGIYVINVGGLVTYTGKIDPLWTGLNGNPLAGLLGLIFLGLIWGTVRLLTKTLAANA